MKESFKAKKWRYLFYQNGLDFSSKFRSWISLSVFISLPSIVLSAIFFLLIFLKIQKTITSSYFAVFSPWFILFGLLLIFFICNAYGNWWNREIDFECEESLSYYYVRLHKMPNMKKKSFDRCLPKNQNVNEIIFYAQFMAIYGIICAIVQLLLIAWKLDSQNDTSWLKICIPSYLACVIPAVFWTLISPDWIVLIGTVIISLLGTTPFLATITVVSLKLDGRITSSFGLILIPMWLLDILFFYIFLGACTDFSESKSSRSHYAAICANGIGSVIILISLILFQVFSVVVGDNPAFSKLSIFIPLLIFFITAFLMVILLILLNFRDLRLIRKFNITNESGFRLLFDQNIGTVARKEIEEIDI